VENKQENNKLKTSHNINFIIVGFFEPFLPLIVNTSPLSLASDILDNSFCS